MPRLGWNYSHACCVVFILLFLIHSFAACVLKVIIISMEVCTYVCAFLYVRHLLCALHYVLVYIATISQELLSSVVFIIAIFFFLNFNNNVDDGRNEAIGNNVNEDDDDDDDDKENEDDGVKAVSFWLPFKNRKNFIYILFHFFFSFLICH